MILEIGKMCYTQLIVLMQLPGYCNAVRETTFTKPQVEFEGLAGYIETKAVLDVIDLALLSKLLDSSGSEENYANRMAVRANVLGRCK